MDIPVIVKILVTLGLILVLNRLTKQLMLAAIIGALTLGIWSGHTAGGILSIVADRITSLDTLMLLVVVLQVIALSKQMSEAGVMKDLVYAVASRISRRASIAVLPAVIGLLPMPGGALFSAPLVDDVDTERNVDSMLKTRINYWFRHVWEYWWPLYPGVLLALHLTKLEPWQLLLLHLPLTICSIVVGYLFLLRHVPHRSQNGTISEIKSSSGLLSIFAPIMVVIATYALIKIFIPAIPEANRYLPMASGILLAILVLQYQRPLGMSKWKSILCAKKSYMMAALVAAIMIYGAFVEAHLPDGTPLVAQMESELKSYGVPIIAVIIILPFISGLAVGLAVGFVGASFPIVLNLIGNSYSPEVILPTTILAFGAGYTGMMLSPVHVCLIVTNEHFKTHLTSSIMKLAKPAGIMFVIILLYYFLVRWLTGVWYTPLS